MPNFLNVPRLPTKFTQVLLQEMNAADEATEQCVPTLQVAVVPQVASEWLLLYVSSVTIQTAMLQKFVGGYIEDFTKS